MSLTVFYGVLDTKSGRLQFANNRHAVPYFFSESGSAKPLHDHAKGQQRFRTETVQMKPGDGLLLYTDGASEAPNAGREWFGKRRIEEYVNLHATAPAERMVLDLFTALRFFSPETAQPDDITVMALRYLG
jgi:sigma-B regulation protein RsbU (phosphoserine phosphatase)